METEQSGCGFFSHIVNSPEKRSEKTAGFRNFAGNPALYPCFYHMLQSFLQLFPVRQFRGDLRIKRR